MMLVFPQPSSPTTRTLKMYSVLLDTYALMFCVGGCAMSWCHLCLAMTRADHRDNRRGLGTLDTWPSLTRCKCWPQGHLGLLTSWPAVHLGSHPGPRLSLTTRSHVGARSWSANIVVCILIPDALSYKIHSWKYIGHEIYPSIIKYKLLWGHLFSVNKYVLQKNIYIGPFVSNSNLGCNIQEAWYSGGGMYNATEYDNINSIWI